MVALITDPVLQEQLIAQRQAAGSDRFDEVWEGVYVMSPLANNEHQGIAAELSAILTIVVQWPKLGQAFCGVNVTDQQHDWTHNYRCPDVAVFLNGTQAEDRDTHWYGGPDFAIEIVSKNDRSLEKLPFYAKVGTRELLLIDRDPWMLTLYRLGDGELTAVGSSTLDDPLTLASNIVPLTWQLRLEDGVPAIGIKHEDGQAQWTILSDDK